MKQKGDFQKKKDFYKQRQMLLDKIKLVQQGIDCVITYNKERWLLSKEPIDDNCRDYAILYSDKYHRPVICFDMSNKDTPNKPCWEQIDGGDWYNNNKNVLCYAKILNEKIACFR